MDSVMKEMPSEELLERLLQQVAIEESNNATFCHICGLYERNHNGMDHQFCKASEEYRCITCGLWFYEHRKNNLNCFDEYIRG